MLLLQKAESGQMEASEAERFAKESLTRMEDAQKRYADTSTQAEQQRQMATKLQANVNDLKTKISSYENDLVTLKARTKTANATRKINQHLYNVDSRGTVALLERMKEKVEEQEALTEAYGDIASSATSVDDEIDKALKSSNTQADDSLARLKAKMAMAKWGA